MKLVERIAAEVMDTIEREKRINRDDLTAAVERVMIADARGRYKRALEVMEAHRLRGRPVWLELEKWAKKSKTK